MYCCVTYFIWLITSPLTVFKDNVTIAYAFFFLASNTKLTGSLSVQLREVSRVELTESFPLRIIGKLRKNVIVWNRYKAVTSGTQSTEFVVTRRPRVTLPHVNKVSRSGRKSASSRDSGLFTSWSRRSELQHRSDSHSHSTSSHPDHKPSIYLTFSWISSVSRG
jgi:hypothetical protein